MPATNTEDGGAGAGAGPKKPVKNSRKKKLNTTDIRFYNDED
jgi:hypothetical protein